MIFSSFSYPWNLCLLFSYIFCLACTGKIRRRETRSHRVMAHRFLVSHGCFTGEVGPRNNVKSFFKDSCLPSLLPHLTFLVLFIHFLHRENKRLLLFVTLFKVDTLCSVSSILRLMNLSICQLIAHQSGTNFL